MTDLTYARARAEVAELLYLEPDELGDTDNLFDAGLDSVRLIGLIERWKSYGVTPNFADLAEAPTLREWWGLLTRRPGA
jgi:bifunctional isochorismate lyase/aryl carrier protein